ncbi:allantoate deiminase [Arboricoccus pini]|uniref:Allantoate deiminase n=1 Tax=Arboricoccus pini TaxID=1963835 RepID=A0A212PVZ6_9PROT|nr:allantoate amidohydrolase [Arboricoccus pini]SNB51145.1 allantoate deiminase [Arboricoccus pini]
MTPGVHVMDRLETLAGCSDEPGALTRLYLSPAHRAAAKLVLSWMEEAGLAAHIDPVGNVVGRIEGFRPGLPALVLGSHIDTVRNAGKYDGNFGVVAAIEAAAACRETIMAGPIALEVVAFGDEEGVRFPATLTGSRAFAGTLDAAVLDLVDSQGVPIAEALARFGGAPERFRDAARQPGEILAYIEAHIEQGPILQAEGLPVGIVTAIAGASRLVFTVNGDAAHAGTVPMAMRRDALTASAAMILEIEAIARETPDLVATVGQAQVLPGAVNTVPGLVRFSLDVRSARDAIRNEARLRIEEACRAIADARGVRLGVQVTHEAPAAPCAPWLQDMLAATVEQLGVRPFRLPSGAGHDGMAISAIAPIAMLFVRCKNGISHHPAESMTVADAELATLALQDVIIRFKDHHDRNG